MQKIVIFMQMALYTIRRIDLARKLISKFLRYFFLPRLCWRTYVRVRNGGPLILQLPGPRSRCTSAKTKQ